MAPRIPEEYRRAFRIRLHTALLDYLQPLAAQRDTSVTKLVVSLLETGLAELESPEAYELHPMTEVYSLSRNPTVKVGTKPMNIYMLPSDHEKIASLAELCSVSLPAVRTSLILEQLENLGLM